MAKSSAVTDYWHRYYIEKGLCSLCGNTGEVDTRGARSPAGIACGRVQPCICPNGQAIRNAQVPRPKPRTVVPLG